MVRTWSEKMRHHKAGMSKPNPRMSQNDFWYIANSINSAPLGRVTKAKLAVHFASKLMLTNNAFKYWFFVEAATGENRYDLPVSITKLVKPKKKRKAVTKQ
jgi:hypothetical protein